MEDILFKMLGIILAVILLFIAPLWQAYERADDISYQIVLTAADELTQTVRHKGYLEENLYKRFLSQLASTGNLYDVEMEHYEQVYVPIVDLMGQPTGEYYEGYEGRFQAEICEDLETLGAYQMRSMDLFFIKIVNRSKTKSQSMKRWLMGISTKSPVIYVRSGGMIWYEPE